MTKRSFHGVINPKVDFESLVYALRGRVLRFVEKKSPPARLDKLPEADLMPGPTDRIPAIPTSAGQIRHIVGGCKRVSNSRMENGPGKQMINFVKIQLGGNSFRKKGCNIPSTNVTFV